jgi:sugar lactone lactonase YvrE
MPRASIYRGMRTLVLVFTLLAAVAALAHPGAAIAVANGRVYFVDTGGGVFSIDAQGKLMREPGPAFHWFAFDAQGRFARTPWPSMPGAEFRSAGAVVLSSDYPVAIGSNGKFYFANPIGGERVRIVAIDPSGARSAGATLPLPWLNGLAAGPGGTLYYTEHRAIRKIDARGRVSTIVENVRIPNCAAVPGIPAEQGPYLRGLALAADGSIYVAASGCAAVLRVDAKGQVSTVLRSSPPWAPTAVAVAGRDVYVLEYLHTVGDDRRQWLPRVRKISSTGVVSTFASSTHTRQ